MKLSRTLLAGFTALATVFAGAWALPTPASAQEMVVRVAPPAPRYEELGPRPGPYHVWQAGTWAWHPEGRYLWHPGRWVVPPQGRTVWVRDEWVSYNGSWHLVPGHWRAVGERIPPAIQRVAVTTEPPAEQVETVGAAPVGHTWIKGRWAWDGVHYAWVPGHVMAIPEGFHGWEPGGWYASHNHWFYRSGYWR